MRFATLQLFWCLEKGTTKNICQLQENDDFLWSTSHDLLTGSQRRVEAGLEKVTNHEPISEIPTVKKGEEPKRFTKMWKSWKLPMILHINISPQCRQSPSYKNEVRDLLILSVFHLHLAVEVTRALTSWHGIFMRYSQHSHDIFTQN